MGSAYRLFYDRPLHLVRGEGVPKDHQRAKRVLEKSCRYGEEVEACRYAKGLLEEIKKAE